ncbi:MAG: hypothetical protein ACTSYB_00270 [Candidatus Helarchaeota archaeon]
MSQPPKLVTIEKEITTLSELEAKKFVTFKTREIASFLKYIHDTLVQNDVNKARQMIAEFLKELADNIKK